MYKNLSIELYLEDVFFYIYCLEENSIYSFVHKPENTSSSIESTLLEFEKNNIYFKSIRCLFFNSFYTLVPQNLFDSTNQKSLLNLNCNSWDGNCVRNDFSESFFCHIIYSYNDELLNIIKKKFPSAKFQHYISVILEQIARQNTKTKENILYLYVKNQNVDLIGLKKGTFHLINSNHFENEEELLYYVLFTLEQLEWDANSISVTLMGDIEKNDKNFDLLYEYIRNLTFFYHNPPWIIPEELASISQHKLLIQN